MPIKPLAEIRVEHPYFASGRCAGARVVADAATAARLRGLRLVTKPAADGLTLFAEFDCEGSPKVPIPAATLRFDLLRLPAELEAATDLTAIAPGTVFVEGAPAGPMKPVIREARARETIVKPAGAADVVLAGRPLTGSAAAAFRIAPPGGGVGVTGFDPGSNRIGLDGPAAAVTLDYPVSPVERPGVFAGIEIDLGPALVAQAAAGRPGRFSVALTAAAARWCYHLVTDLANPIGEWRITHAAADGPAASFGAAGRAEVAAPDAGDPFGSDLARRSAPLRVLRFVSDAPVACSETRARRVALFAGDRQLIAALPNPSPAAIRRVGGQAAFGEVLRFVTA